MKTYFIRDMNGYRVNPAIREMVVFAAHDMIKDPPFTNLDILSCRNVLIYMESALQNKIITVFNYSLKPNGILMLGTSESLGNHEDWFLKIDGKMKIFKRTSNILSPRHIDYPSSLYTNKQMANENKLTFTGVNRFQLDFEQILLKQFSPISVLINKVGDILYITGRTGQYLEPVSGKADWNICNGT